MTYLSMNQKTFNELGGINGLSLKIIGSSPSLTEYPGQPIADISGNPIYKDESVPDGMMKINYESRPK